MKKRVIIFLIIVLGVPCLAILGLGVLMAITVPWQRDEAMAKLVYRDFQQGVDTNSLSALPGQVLGYSARRGYIYIFAPYSATAAERSNLTALAAKVQLQDHWRIKLLFNANLQSEGQRLSN